MPTCAETLARTLRDAGVTRMFGLPGGEMLDFLDAARRAGIRFILTRHEATAAFMADVTGQIQRRPGVCVATLGPGAVNMTLGVANAYLDRSPRRRHHRRPRARQRALRDAPAARPQRRVPALHEAWRSRSTERTPKARSAKPCESHVRRGWVPSTSRCPATSRAGEERRSAAAELTVRLDPEATGPASPEAIERVAAAIAAARRPIVILGLDLDPRADVAAVRAFVEAHGRAHVRDARRPRACCRRTIRSSTASAPGVAGDRVVLDLFERADLLVGVGFEPVESDKLWHHTMPLVSVGPGVDRGRRPSVRARKRSATCRATLAELGRRPHAPRGLGAGDGWPASARTSSASCGRRRGREASPATS